MLSHRQNSRALRGRRCTCRGEAQNREGVKFIKKHPVAAELVNKFPPLIKIRKFIIVFTRAATGSCPEPDKSNRQVIAVLVLKPDSVVITSNAKADTFSFYVLKTSVMLQ
jgi:hypothetical protein